MIYYKEDYVTVHYFEDQKLVEVEWHGMVLSRHFRETLEMVLDLVKEKQVENFLVNRQNMQRISLADENWRENTWYPQFLKSPICRTASVISKDYYTEVSVARLIEDKDKAIRIERRSFYDYQEARNWLLQPQTAEAARKDKPQLG